MLTEDWNNQVFTAFCKSDDSYPPIAGAFHPADKSFFEQAIDRHADGPLGVRWTFGPIVFTDSGPLCRSASSTRKSVSEMPVSSIPVYR